MHFDYDRASIDYDTFRRGGGPYFPLLQDLARQTACRRILEIGAGTGNNTGLLADILSVPIVALEQSRGMLHRGAAKPLQAHWVRGRGEDAPFRQGAFDFIFACYVLHHIPDLNTFFASCARVLDRGIAAFITVPQDFIQSHPMNAYFPSFAVIDSARFQPVPDVEEALRSASFHSVQSENTRSEPAPIDEAYVAKIEARYISTYDLIPPDEFSKGLAQLKRDVAAKGALHLPMVREATVVWGHRGG
jgi:SAM-dependent methyltransferase